MKSKIHLLPGQHFIQFQPLLAKEVGLNEAIFLSHLAFRINEFGHLHEGRFWVFNSYEDWGKEFPFWSLATIKRTIQSLKKQNLIFSRSLNSNQFNKTNWYTVNEEKVNEVQEKVTEESAKRPDRLDQNDLVREGQNDPMNNIKEEPNKNYKSICRASPTPPLPDEDKKQVEEPKEEIPYQEIVDHLNEQTGSSFRPSSRKTREKIRARFSEGYDLEDFKAVIDAKAVEWMKSEKMARYLRPETLFGPKFEGYLQEARRGSRKPPKSEYEIQFEKDLRATMEGWQ